MKFVTFYNPEGHMRAGWLDGNRVIDMKHASKGELPDNMADFIKNNEKYMANIEVLSQGAENLPAYSLEEIRLTAPLPNPVTFRDYVAFETHIKNATSRNGDTVAPEWYEMPIFYFSNPHTMKGPGDEVKRPAKCIRLDYELELACIIGKQGKNIKADEAEDYIFGYTILNDWSARDLQMKEMKVLLGPAKGKDFATSIGPYLLTKDELEPFKTNGRFDLEMTAAVNGEILSRGNFKDIYYTFGDMIERASEDVTLYPGDIIGSGTVGFGCIMELGPEVHRWLEPGDEVELTITALGSLKNRII
ncbi:fumarylacetoacetate hydrolase family protein [Neobacillus cucumis]|uniref:fumarylacetoacetate hydrolase family protein n=1 Tax=Neobacillus cucumis TaxID=1740721 RepID=UPI0019644C17|nr:fumarylacetoacetate hydrolase family protein [Neobacillus cucumis]MBM7652384.1 2-keto-4-pentenoate hydratase/2-oxohepta-3-ene-1,7-dioic acid hydratase in catechol pathway [Neobacillus cucumis]